MKGRAEQRESAVIQTQQIRLAEHEVAALKGERSRPGLTTTGHRHQEHHRR